MYRSSQFLAILALTFLLPAILLADGAPKVATEKEVIRVPAEQIDPRLPPVIPGQQVTAGGKRHVVISTAGPVPVSPAPEAPAPGYSENSASRYEGSGYHSGSGAHKNNTHTLHNSGVTGIIVDKRK
jgi:hypothetical protein